MVVEQGGATRSVAWEEIGECRRCGRALSDKESRRRGLGPVCATKAVADLASVSGGKDVLDVTWEPATGDVVCWRNPQDEYEIHVNVPMLDTTWKNSAFEFGYGGTGPAAFALNILLWYGVKKEEALYHGRVHDFKFQYVATLPREGGTIPGAAIRAWIAAHITPVPRPEQADLHLEELAAW